MHRSRSALALGAVALIAATSLTACSNQGESDVTTVTGTCAMDTKQYDELSPLSTSRLEALLGEGDYRVEGNVRPGANGVPDAGECSYARTDDRETLRLQVGVNRKTDLFRSYDEARALQKTAKAQPIDGVDGFIIADPGHRPGSGDHGPLAVVFGPDNWTVTVHVVVPGKDTADDDSLASAAKEAAKNLGEPMQPA
jgi:hypothetical protein